MYYTLCTKLCDAEGQCCQGIGSIFNQYYLISNDILDKEHSRFIIDLSLILEPFATAKIKTLSCSTLQIKHFPLDL